jgi:hypothetical protein
MYGHSRGASIKVSVLFSVEWVACVGFGHGVDLVKVVCKTVPKSDSVMELNLLPHQTLCTGNPSDGKALK